jgi:hypothetical protein
MLLQLKEKTLEITFNVFGVNLKLAPIVSNKNKHKSNKNLDTMIDATSAQLPKKVICTMIFAKMKSIG